MQSSLKKEPELSIMHSNFCGKELEPWPSAEPYIKQAVHWQGPGKEGSWCRDKNMVEVCLRTPSSLFVYLLIYLTAVKSINKTGMMTNERKTFKHQTVTLNKIVSHLLIELNYQNQ